MDGIEDLHIEALEQFERAEKHENENRLLAEEDFAFVAGDGQWPEAIKQQRQLDNRPCLTSNRLPAFVAQVVGDARQNKPAIKVHPEDDVTDPQKAEIFEGIIRYIETASSATQAYLSAFEHAASGGFGHWRILTEYSNPESFDQDIRIKRISDPFSVYWDNNSTDYCRQDAMWCFVTDYMTKEAFDRKYPDEEGARDWESSHVRKSFGGWVDTTDRVRVAEYWRKKEVKKTISQMPDGSVLEGKQDGALKTRESIDYEVERYILSGEKIIKGPEKWPGKHIPIVTTYGPEEFIDGRIRYRSIIRHAKDPQRMYNFWQTAITEKIALSPRAPFIGTVEHFKGLERYWDNANNLNKAYLPYNPDPKSPGVKPERQQPAAINAAEIQQSMQAIDDLKATTGIHDASLGAKGNETSGRAILARQREGDTATFAWIDNLSRGIEHTGRILIDLIPKIYDTQRVIRILGEDGSEKFATINEMQYDPMSGIVEVLNDLSVGRFDVTVTVGPSYATKRIEAAESMMGFMQAYPNAAPIIGDLIAKNMDWPGADDIAERLKKTIPPEILDEEKSPEEMQQQAEAMKQQQAMQQEAYKLDKQAKIADIRAKMAKAQKDLSEAEAQDIENDATQAGIIGLMERLNG